MKKIAFFLVFLCSIGILNAFAQEQITGKVTSADDGLGIPGVSVIVKGTTTGTSTDIDGNYTLRANPEDILVFSFVGMTSQEILIGDQTVINVVLQSETIGMDEVVVVGYGTRSKKNIISSVAKVKEEAIKEVAVASIDAALQGQAPGLVVSQNSGAPGQGMSIRVRGATTVSGSNQPLYVVDGIPVITGNTASDSYGGQGGNALTNLSPSEIESVEVLKDASASAIYGSRASNGVILITTKRGKTGKPRVEFSTYFGIQNPINKYKVMNQGEYYQFADLAFANAGGRGTSYWSWANGYVSSNELTGSDAELAEFYQSTAGDNYVDAIYRDDQPIVETNISVSGGNEKTKYFVGATMFKQDGVVKGQEYDRQNIRFNFDQKISDWVKMNFGLSVSDEEVKRINGDNNIYAATTTSVLEAPGYDLYNEDGSFNISDFRFSNPLQNALETDGVNNSLRFLGNFGVDFNFNEWVQGLTLNTKWGLDRLDYRERRYFPSNSNQGLGTNGNGTVNTDTYTRWITTNTLNFQRDFDDLYMDALLGMEYQQLTSVFTGVDANNFPSPQFRWPASGADPIVSDASKTQNKLYSYFARVAANYQDKYLAEVSLRADASSKFGKDNQTGWFPSFSLGWKIHNETWMNVEQISELKAKVGYGVVGNESAIDNFASRTLAESAQYASAPGVAVSQLGDDNLSWEKTSQINAGITIGLLNDRITLDYEYFFKKTTDLLLATPLPPSSGFTSILGNVGEMENKGHEISLSALIVKESWLNWRMDFSISTLKNEVTKLFRGADGVARPIDSGFASRVQEGEALGAFFVFDATGIDENGDVTYNDRNGDGVITDDDKYFAGKPLPDYSGSIRNTFSAYGLELSVLFQFSQGFELYNNSLAFAGASGSFAFNKFRSQLDYWTPENTDTNLPRPMFGAQQSANNRDSDRFIEDGSYVRLKNITLGYNVPQKFTKDFKVKVWVGADNIKTWTDYSGLDPEVNAFGSDNVSTGTDFFTQGLNYTLKAGLNVTF